MMFIFTRKSMTCTKRRPYNRVKYNHEIKKKVYHRDLEYFGEVPDWPYGILYHYVCQNCGCSVITEGEELIEGTKI